MSGEEQGSYCRVEWRMLASENSRRVSDGRQRRHVENLADRTAREEYKTSYQVQEQEVRTEDKPDLLHVQVLTDSYWLIDNFENKNFSRDGLLVCGACMDGSIQLWDHRKSFVNVTMQVRMDSYLNVEAYLTAGVTGPGCSPVWQRDHQCSVRLRQQVHRHQGQRRTPQVVGHQEL